MSTMTVEEKLTIMQSIAEECIEERELRSLLQEKPNPICYDGFEPSGRMHIAQIHMCNTNHETFVFCFQGVGKVFPNYGSKREGCPDCCPDYVSPHAVCRYILPQGRHMPDGHGSKKGTKEDQQKMSKSDPSSAIFMEDDESQVNSKIAQAFCPHKIIEGNPCLGYIKYIIFPWFERFEVLRKEADGGNKTYNGIEELFEDYDSGTLHPDDVKPALAKAINEILQPVRDHFSNNPDAKALLETVKVHSFPPAHIVHIHDMDFNTEHTRKLINGAIAPLQAFRSAAAVDHITKELKRRHVCVGLISGRTRSMTESDAIFAP
ncbi:Tyrosine--tRNA ligase 1, cytoplasmic [Dichanthelium oligosanthes]|uniref:tyrosine--tRNA ligase n=1 Tax=Dichanthelium oligosanthes TaxID=888268 RepID=A0A1E5VHK4_9POAL|nr:Tyrosine--tRNA ligase 1, cytoplasmic [Dichanthelium oligosanthes]